MPQRDTQKWLWLATAGFQRVGQESPLGNSHFVKRIAWEPRIDILELDNEVLILVELAAVEHQGIQIEFETGSRMMTIRGRRDVPGETCGRPHQLEIYYGEFERQTQLPEIVYDLDSTTAELRDGMLRITLKKQASQ